MSNFAPCGGKSGQIIVQNSVCADFFLGDVKSLRKSHAKKHKIYFLTKKLLQYWVIFLIGEKAPEKMR